MAALEVVSSNQSPVILKVEPKRLTVGLKDDKHKGRVKEDCKDFGLSKGRMEWKCHQTGMKKAV